eukprot:TRINITY_DN1041_c0_g1_i7.p2 TRINITY_DN1041_c0_g1~~TRINITY_DN1041_c0_g1_i7.p2  ORF type:complete len:240 (-),score=31.14 TRINITY_DN1041_c0_g1_i7:246-965(-)
MEGAWALTRIIRFRWRYYWQTLRIIVRIMITVPERPCLVGTRSGVLEVFVNVVEEEMDLDILDFLVKVFFVRKIAIREVFVLIQEKKMKQLNIHIVVVKMDGLEKIVRLEFVQIIVQNMEFVRQWKEDLLDVCVMQDGFQALQRIVQFLDNVLAMELAVEMDCAMKLLEYVLATLLGEVLIVLCQTVLALLIAIIMEIVHWIHTLDCLFVNVKTDFLELLVKLQNVLKIAMVKERVYLL